MRFDRDKGKWTPTINIKSAEVFGPVEVLVQGRHVHAAMVTQPTIYKMRHALRNFDDDDYLLPVGDPSLVAMAAAMAAKANMGRFKLLRWNRQDKRYDVVEVVL